MKIAHLADIHNRFSSRHEEYRNVFKTLYKYLKKQKPDRIEIVGDLNHQKISMSPGSLNISAEFLINLAKIAPVDVFLGNHDMNASQKEQGDTISPMFEIVEKFSELLTPALRSKMLNSFIVSEDNKDDINFEKNGIYFFPDSGFYKINDKITYGVFSCKDEIKIELKKKEEGVTYIAFYHGQVVGAIGDNGYELFGDDLANPSVFKDFDIVMLGDIHEQQDVGRKDGSMAYCGSLIQQNNGESLEKGYLLWDIDKREYEKVVVPNEIGYTTLTIAKGELSEERIKNIKFSDNPKKTKVSVVWEEYEENYSTEKESQIVRAIKETYGCESVSIHFNALEKELTEKTIVEDAKNSDTFVEQLEEYVNDLENDMDKDALSELLDFARKADVELEIKDISSEPVKWEMNSVEISNIFSFDAVPVKIIFDRYQGLTGIFGKNYTGKTNTIKAITWGLYQQILDNGDAKKLVNIYTDSNKGYVKTYLTINGDQYRINRKVETKITKAGKTVNNYPVSYEKLTFDNDDNEIWVAEASEETATEKVEVKKIILNAIGSFEDFVKVSVQSQSGIGGYLNQKQQPKNDLINRFMGLEFFRDRYDYGKDFLNSIKREKKDLGKLEDAETDIVNIKSKIKTYNSEIEGYKKAKIAAEKKQEKSNNTILSLTKKLKELPELVQGEFSEVKKIDEQLNIIKAELAVKESENTSLEDWLKVNFEKELNIAKGVTEESIQKSINKEAQVFQDKKKEFIAIDNWIKDTNNSKKGLIIVEGYLEEITVLNGEITNLNAVLPTYKGHNCPTCGHETKKSSPALEISCVANIKLKKETVELRQQSIAQNNVITASNNLYDVNVQKLETLKATLISIKSKKEQFEKDLTFFKSSLGIIDHNSKVASETAKLKIVKADIIRLNENSKLWNANKDKLDLIETAKKHNANIDDDLESESEILKGYKYEIFGLDEKITDLSGELKLANRDFSDYEKIYDKIFEAEKKFKIYSLYLQAVHRDGIPARIIRKKLPIVNSKINSILSSIVTFRVDLEILDNGDIVEGFYYSEDKSDMLPLSSASGAQRFIATLAIKDALHYISNLIKPSLTIIDEGFGSLDDEHISGIVDALLYLKRKYKNVLIITHRNEIKDFVDNIIEAYKDTSGIPQNILDVNPKAGITKLNII